MDRYKITITKENKELKVLDFEAIFLLHALEELQRNTNFIIWDTIKIERSKSVLSDEGKETGHTIIKFI